MQNQYQAIQAQYKNITTLPETVNVPDKEDLSIASGFILMTASMIDENTEPLDILRDAVAITNMGLAIIALCGFTANQLQIAMDIINTSNSKRIDDDGDMVNPNMWEKLDLSPCMFVETEYPEWYINQNKPPHEIGYRYLKKGENYPKTEILQYYDGKKWVMHTSHKMYNVCFMPESSIYSLLHRVPANYPIKFESED